MKLTSSDYRIVALLWVLILSGYLLVYANAPLSIDGADTLDVAATLLQHGVPSATRLTTPRQLIESNGQQEFYNLSPDGERYSKKGVTPSLALLPFVGLSQATPALSTRATAMLLNPLITMLTAWQLYIFARYLKSPPLTAALLALIFAFATFSIAYVKTLFGEPLAALLLLAAVYHAYVYTHDRRIWRAAVAGAAVGLCIGANLTYALLTVPVGLYILWAHKDLRAGIVFGVPVALTMLFLAGWNLIRFGSPFSTGYDLANSIEGFTTPFWHGFVGLWASFYKGVFWYQPILLAGFGGLFTAWRTRRGLLLLCLTIIGLHTVSYASWWAWDGAWSWGPRFMLPLLPLMMLSLLPVLGAARRNLRARAVVIALVAASVALQIPGVLFSYIPFYETVYDSALFNWRNHIALAAYAGLYDAPLQPALLSEGFDRVHLVAVAASFAAGLFAVLRLRGTWRSAVIAAALIAACCVTAARQQHKPSYASVREWEQLSPAGSTVYIQSFEFDTQLLDMDDRRLIVVNPHGPQEHPLVAAQWHRAKELNGSLWLVTWFLPGSAENWAERELWENYPFVEQKTVGGHRAVRFDLNMPAGANCETALRFDTSIELDAYGTRRDENGFYVTLIWRAAAIPAANYSWFVHLVDAQSEIVAQQDRMPGGGYMPPTTWQAGQAVTDYLMFPIPRDTSLENWQLRIGYVDPATGAPLTVQDTDGRVLDTPFAVLPVTC
jgi:hypothetical protein